MNSIPNAALPNPAGALTTYPIVPKQSQAGDFEPYPVQCTCSKGGTCYNDQHDQEGGPCPNEVIMSRKNRHKVCNRCRKPKKSRLTGSANRDANYTTCRVASSDSSNIGLSLVPSTNQMNPSAGGLPGLLMLEGSMPMVPGALPSMAAANNLVDGNNSLVMPMNLTPATDNPMLANALGHSAPLGHHNTVTTAGGPKHKEVKETGSMNCACSNGGQCHRSKHVFGYSCDRTVKLTDNDKHTVCKGCRYSKRKSTDATNNMTSTNIDANGNVINVNINMGGLGNEGSRKKARGNNNALNDDSTTNVSALSSAAGLISSLGGVGVGVPMTGLSMPIPSTSAIGSMPGLPIPGNMLGTVPPALDSFTATTGANGELSYNFTVPANSANTNNSNVSAPNALKANEL